MSHVYKFKVITNIESLNALFSNDISLLDYIHELSLNKSVTTVKVDKIDNRTKEMIDFESFLDNKGE